MHRSPNWVIFGADNDRQQQTKLITLPLAHACGVIKGGFVILA